MLLKSLQYFGLRLWGTTPGDDRVRISGETYWLYRIYMEGVLFAIMGSGVFYAFFIADAPKFELANRVGLAFVFAFVWFLEFARLRIELREQREFAELFYG